MTSGNETRRVSIIGLGNMGASLAHALLKAGVQLTVWNRSPAKAESIVKAGATVAISVAEAVTASPLTLVCLTDAAASRLVYRTPETALAIKGRTLADLSTGTAAAAREAASWIDDAGGQYLDGGILCYPRDIGTQDACILYAGKSSAFREHDRTLSILAGAQRHLGEEPGAAATAYLALWAFYFGSLTAYFEAAGLAATAEVSVEHFQELAATMIPKLTDGIADATNRLMQSNFAGDQAPIDIYIENLILVRDTFAGARASHLTVDAFLSLLQESKQAGDGAKDVAALFQRTVSRANSGRTP